MDSTNDPIKALLEKTGLSCDDLLQKLLAYKSQKEDSESTSKNSADSNPTSSTKNTNDFIADAISSEKPENSSSQSTGNRVVDVISSNQNDENNKAPCEHTPDFDIQTRNESVSSQSSEVSNGTKCTSQKESPLEQELSCEIAAGSGTEEKKMVMEHGPDQMKETGKKLCNGNYSTTEVEADINVIKDTLHNTIDESIASEKVNALNLGYNLKNQYEVSKSFAAPMEVISPDPCLRLTEEHTILKRDNESETMPEENECVSIGLPDKTLQIESLNETVGSNTTEKNYSEDNVEQSVGPSDESSFPASPEISEVLKSVPDSIEEIKKNDEKSTNEIGSILRKRKSISDELVRRLVKRIDEDENAECKDKLDNGAEDLDPKVTETSNERTDEDIQRENDIEVCQIEDFEEIESKPLLKLRNDLFEDNAKCHFLSSDDEAEDVNRNDSLQIKKFLQTVEEVTGDVVDNSSDSKAMSPKVLNREEKFKPISPKLRKVKIGFLKKKILHKAIKHINLVDSKKFEIMMTNSPEAKNSAENDNAFQLPLRKSSLESEIDTPEAQEEVRKNLKLQLSSLRNRKKIGSLVQNEYKKATAINDFRFNYKRKVQDSSVPSPSNFSDTKDSSVTSPSTTSDKDNSVPSPPNTSVTKDSSVPSPSMISITKDSSVPSPTMISVINESSLHSPPIISNINTSDCIIEPQTSTSTVTEHTVPCSSQVDVHKDDALFSLSEETNFMIIDVQGGVEFPDNDEVTTEDDTVKELHSDAIKLTKTNDITKIKGWKNKKFDVVKETDVIEEKNLEKGIRESLTEENLCDLTPIPEISEDNSNIDKTSKIEENSNEELSPFVSNTLEEFLTENSTLNISYKIPKLGAEEGLKEQTYKDVVVAKSHQPTSSDPEKKEKFKGVKPKTLAEKRRMLEGKITKKIYKEERPQISKTSYVRFNGVKVYVSSRTSNKCLADIKHTPVRWKKSIDTTNTKVDSTKKLSLLKSWHEQIKSVSYKPGPLSLKPKLQNCESISMWDTKVKKLPRIKLEIIPEVGKAIPAHLVHLLPKFSPIITEDRLEFALSAVLTKSEDKVKTCFRFSVPYANKQKYTLVTTLKENNQGNIIVDIKPEKNSVASVIDDLITYVEIKEMEDTVIKNAEPYDESEYETDLKPVKINELNVAVADAMKKRKKLDGELRKLSCKVVSVAVDAAEIENPDCRKPFCKLGCVCRSLACIPRLPIHCLKKECMLECNCSINNKVDEVGESPLLSSDAVTRIEDQAKRYLAKVEKEFTQTIIHANDKTILIPSSDRSKTKRIKKAPKRYSDFLEHFDEDVETLVSSKKSESSKDSKNYNCFVKLERLDTRAMIPLCMNHKSYNCPCIVMYKTQGRNISASDEETRSTKKPKKYFTEEEDSDEEIAVLHRIKKKRKYVSDEDNPIKETAVPQETRKRKKILIEEETQTQEIPVPRKYKKRKKSFSDEDRPIQEIISHRSKKLKRKKRKRLKESSENSDEQCSDVVGVEIEALEDISGRGRKKKNRECARIFGVHPQFLARNAIPFYKTKLRMKVKNMESYNTADISDLPNLCHTEKLGSGEEDIDVTTPATIPDAHRLKLLLHDYSKHKRKQVLEVREDVESDISKTRLNISKKERRSQDSVGDLVIGQNSDNLPYASVFDGEIVIPTNENRDFVKKLGMKSVAPYMRLLPWNDLLRNYYNLKINIWSSHDKTDKLIINTCDKKPPEGYVEISKSKRKNGIMTWILTKELPTQTPAELVHLILSPTDQHFEISGICLKNIHPSSEKRMKMKSCSNKDYSNNKVKMENVSVDENDVNEDSHNQDDPNFLEHKNHNNEMNVLCMTQHEFCPQYFHLCPTSEDLCYESFPLAVELPIIRLQFRWRMLYLNSNFSFLSFINNKYSIKYTDLMHILKKAQQFNKTICLQSKQLSSGYSQKNYGIYAVPRYRDRLFIGPYRRDEDHGLETLRYLRQSLVSTSYFEMVQGGANPNNKKAVWLITKGTKTRENEVVVNNPRPQSVLKSNVNNLKKMYGFMNLEETFKTEEKSEYAELTPMPNSSAVPQVNGTGTENIACADQRKELEILGEHSNLADGTENFITSIDLEEKPFIKFPNFILINGKKMKPQEYNRYIMTNIPHFGYLGAIQNEQTKAIDIDWPFANKILRFPNVSPATEFLKRRFTNLLLPVPASFQIQLIILREIDFSTHSPVDAKILSGTYICGEFGVVDSRKLTPLLAETLGTTQEDVLKRLAKRAQYLGALEIGKLKEQERMLIQMKKDLILKKQNNLAKYMTLLMNFPEKRRLEEYDKFRHKFNGRPGSTLSKMTKRPLAEVEKMEVVGKTEAVETKEVVGKKEDLIECIEIDDSDSSESENASLGSSTKQIVANKQTTPSPKKDIIVKSDVKSTEKSEKSPLSLTSASDGEAATPLEGYKFVKAASGKLILMKNKSGMSLSKSLTGMKMTIRNNRVVKRDIFQNKTKDLSKIVTAAGSSKKVDDSVEEEEEEEENDEHTEERD